MVKNICYYRKLNDYVNLRIEMQLYYMNFKLYIIRCVGILIM
jgi:hypothetical protein